jgi:hypothetical protein
MGAFPEAAQIAARQMEAFDEKLAVSGLVCDLAALAATPVAAQQRGNVPQQAPHTLNPSMSHQVPTNPQGIMLARYTPAASRAVARKCAFPRHGWNRIRPRSRSAS